MSNRRDDEDRHKTSADRIRRRMEQLEEHRRNAKPKISPFTLISVVAILAAVLFVASMMGN